MINEIIPEVRNKPQSPYFVLEQLADGKDVPKSFIKSAILDLSKVEELLFELEAFINKSDNP